MTRRISPKPESYAIDFPQEDYITSFNSDFRLDPSATALVIIDMQYASACRTTGLGRWLAERGEQHVGEYRFTRIEEVVLPNVCRVLDFFRGRGMPVVYVTVGSEVPDYSDVPALTRNVVRATNNRRGTREHEILDEIRPLDSEYVINKTTNGAFNSSGIDSLLRALGARFLLHAGVSTNMCVDTTARDAADRGYRCVILEDCCAAAKEEYHRAALLTFQRLFGKVMTAAAALQELEGGRR